MPSAKQIDSNTYPSLFSPVLGGRYRNSTLADESAYGYWWGSTASNSAFRYYLSYDGTNLSTGGGYRYNGFYIRCVSEEKDVSDLTYMQDMTAKVVTNPKGWTLPSKDQIDSLSGGESGSSIYLSNFLPVLGGYYNNGTLNGESNIGFWWGATMYDGAVRYSLDYNGSNLYTYSITRHRGYYIRCIQAS
ncbi:hypothetical protein IKF84_00735 [Candidatus Saccharibacteria bacterium]|nr:hypothetical protein [Candidatus Saccharibacteria bacterium]